MSILKALFEASRPATDEMRNNLIKNAILHAKMARYAPADLALLYRNHARELIAEARGI